MKFIDIIAVIIGALALISLLSREPVKSDRQVVRNVERLPNFPKATDIESFVRIRDTLGSLYPILESEDSIHQLFSKQESDGAPLSQLRELCHEERTSALKLVFSVVDGSAAAGEERRKTMARLTNSYSALAAAWRMFKRSPDWPALEQEQKEIQARQGGRTCPIMGREEQRRFLIEYFRYIPTFLEAGRRAYPETFAGVEAL